MLRCPREWESFDQGGATEGRAHKKPRQSHSQREGWRDKEEATRATGVRLGSQRGAHCARHCLFIIHVCPWLSKTGLFQKFGRRPPISNKGVFAVLVTSGVSALPWRMYSLPKPRYDPETMRAVALAYRRERQAGQLDQPAREAAIAAFRARHPELNRMPASEATAHIIAWVAREHSAWFWRGVGLPEHR